MTKKKLYGERIHQCPDWDYMWIDETCSEFECCFCELETCTHVFLRDENLAVVKVSIKDILLPSEQLPKLVEWKNKYFVRQGLTYLYNQKHPIYISDEAPNCIKSY